MEKPPLILGTERLAIVRLNPTESFPKMDEFGKFWSITRTEDEISLVLSEKFLSSGWKAERGWRSFQMKGPLDFSLTGILASVAVPLAKANISIFVISTFDTDYFLVKENCLEEAISVLVTEGYEIIIVEKEE
ncbi:MAG: ACT domain-containing protein [Promethearchaeota archaeon]